MRETTVEKALRAAAKAAGGEAWKWVSPGANGVPDRLVTIPDVPVFAVETKAPRKGPEDLQAVVHKRLRKMNLPVFVVDTPDDARALIKMVTGA